MGESTISGLMSVGLEAFTTNSHSSSMCERKVLLTKLLLAEIQSTILEEVVGSKVVSESQMGG